MSVFPGRGPRASPPSPAKRLAQNGSATAAGVPVLPTIPTRLRDERGTVIDELRSAYGEAARRPRPGVRALRPSPVAAG